MNKIVKISLVIAFILALILSVFVWRLLGKPYYRISQIGTEYIENSNELIYANEQLENKLYLIKKYRYSIDRMLLGFGGGATTDDYYYYGIADKHRNIVLEPKFQFISSKTNSQKESIIIGRSYIENGNQKTTYYLINSEGIKPIDEKHQ